MVLNIHWDSYKISVVRKIIKVVHSRKCSNENKMQKNIEHFILEDPKILY